MKDLFTVAYILYIIHLKHASYLYMYTRKFIITVRKMRRLLSVRMTRSLKLKLQNSS